MSLVNRIKELIKSEKNLTMKSLEEKTGLKVSTISRWDTNYPSYDKVLKVANYFNVSVEWLITGIEPTPSNFSEQDLIFLKYISSLTDENKTKIEGMLELKIYEQKLEEKKEQEIKEVSLYTYNNVVDYSPANVQEKETSYNNAPKIPVIGRTAAGDFIHITEEGVYDLEIVQQDSRADYALEVDGHSMEPLIKNGSYIEVQETNYVDNGTIAIVKYNDQVTCKRFFNDGNGKIRLESLNPNYQDIYLQLTEYDAENDNFRIIGEVLI